MAETAKPSPMVRTFLTDLPAATAKASMALMNKRSTALADYWRSLAGVRQPDQLLELQMDYWTQLVDDYQEAFTQGMSQLTAPAPSRNLTLVPRARMAHNA